MTAPNRNALWARAFVAELAAAGVSAVCLAPGSRSTPLTVAVADHPDVEALSHLDERSAAFFALGRGKRTGRPTPVVCTSGTAAANFHPAVMEADRARVPLLVLTADRPPELTDSGANQTADQEKLYGDAVRWYRDMPEPEADPRKLRMVRTTAARAVARSTGTNPGPVHLNFRFRKPLEPTPVPGDVPEDFADRAPLAATGREGDGPFVRTATGRPALDPATLDALAEAVATADRGLVVAGPHHGGWERPAAVADLAGAAGFPLLADPLSGLRFGPHVADADVPACGGYDAYLDPGTVADWPDPDLVVRVGASPTSKTLRHYLRDADARQVVVDPAGGWPEAEFTATDLLVADPGHTAAGLADRIEASSATDRDVPGDPDWRRRFETAEGVHWDRVGEARRESFFEGLTLAEVAEVVPDPATVFVSNSMPVRDLDRFARPRDADLAAVGNRGVSGIDGVTSSALGAASATDDPLVAVVGDLAYYHDMNGLLALSRCGIDATVVLVNNDGGGIFHELPIAGFDPPFTDLFETPHGLDFAPTEDLYGLSFQRVEGRDGLRAAVRDSAGNPGARVVEVAFDAGESHDARVDLTDRIRDAVAEATTD